MWWLEPVTMVWIGGAIVMGLVWLALKYWSHKDVEYW